MSINSGADQQACQTRLEEKINQWVMVNQNSPSLIKANLKKIIRKYCKPSIKDGAIDIDYIKRFYAFLKALIRKVANDNAIRDKINDLAKSSKSLETLDTLIEKFNIDQQTLSDPGNLPKPEFIENLIATVFIDLEIKNLINQLDSLFNEVCGIDGQKNPFKLTEEEIKNFKFVYATLIYLAKNIHTLPREDTSFGWDESKRVWSPRGPVHLNDYPPGLEGEKQIIEELIKPFIAHFNLVKKAQKQKFNNQIKEFCSQLSGFCLEIRLRGAFQYAKTIFEVIHPFTEIMQSAVKKAEKTKSTTYFGIFIQILDNWGKPFAADKAKNGFCKASGTFDDNSFYLIKNFLNVLGFMPEEGFLSSQLNIHPIHLPIFCQFLLSHDLQKIKLDKKQQENFQKLMLFETTDNKNLLLIAIESPDVNIEQVKWLINNSSPMTLVTCWKKLDYLIFKWLPPDRAENIIKAVIERVKADESAYIKLSNSTMTDGNNLWTLAKNLHLEILLQSLPQLTSKVSLTVENKPNESKPNNLLAKYDKYIHQQLAILSKNLDQDNQKLLHSIQYTWNNKQPCSDKMFYELYQLLFIANQLLDSSFGHLKKPISNPQLNRELHAAIKNVLKLYAANIEMPDIMNLLHRMLGLEQDKPEYKKIQKLFRRGANPSFIEYQQIVKGIEKTATERAALITSEQFVASLGLLSHKRREAVLGTPEPKKQQSDEKPAKDEDDGGSKTEASEQTSLHRLKD